MNFDYSPEQKELRDAARKFLEGKSPTSVARRVLDDASLSFDADLWREIAAQGWIGAAIPEQYGGLGLSRVDLCAIAEELGRALAPTPFASTVYFVAEGIEQFGTEAQKQKWLPAIASGDVIGCLATAERPGPLTADAISCAASRQKIRGAKLPVIDGAIADIALVLADEGGKKSLFIVDLKASGVSREALQTIDPTRGAAKIVFEGASAERLGETGAGMEQVQHILDRAAVYLAFEQIGGADRALEMARDYALSRYAFGRPIGSFQAIKHKLADVYVKNELARSHAYYGAWALASDASALPEAAAAARVSASEAFWLAAKENIQTHGGMGFTWAMDCHLYYRRAQHLALAAGAPAVWRERLVAQLEMKNVA
ncbi:MAG: acyl-CoA dehydrogenase family protein [Hyphomonadaceae bacterium]